MNRFRVFVWGLALTGATLVAAGSLSAQTTTRDKYQARLEQKAKARSAFNLRTHTPDFTLNVNNWLCGLASDGEICTNTFGSTTGGGGFWPIGTPNQYSFFAGLQMAARSPLDPTKFAAAHCFNVSATNAGCRPLSNVYHSDLDTDLATWPGSCNLWNPQTGEYVKTLSQLDTCVRYWDGDPVATVPGGHPLGVEVTQHSLAFTLQGFRDMIFFIFKIKNISNSAAFRQANASLNVPADGWTLEDFYVAVGHDADVSADEVDENFGTFVPFLRLAPDTIPLFLATIWQSDFVAGDFTPYAQCGFCSNPGFVGTTFLRSPYNNTGKTITTNTVGVVRTIPSLDDRARLEALRLAAAQGDTEAQDTLAVYEIGQSFGSLTTRGGVFPDAADAAQSWRYYSGNLSAAERALNPNSPPGFGFVDQPQHADTRYLHATGPIKLAPGDSVEVIVGLVAGAPVLTVPGFVPAQGVEPLHGIPGDTARLLEKIMGRGVEGTNYPSVFKQVLDARTLFETNFLLPSPPASPTVTAIPGDREVKVIWSGEAAVDTVGDPYYPVAIQRGLTTFRKVDFEGYRVYRRVRPNAAPELIAQYDLKNGLTSVITTTDSVITADGSVVPVKQDTAIAGEDTGLRFSLIDRGGKFPDPANGPGLLNGVTYYYTVTAYDINTPFAPGGSSLESGQRLSAKIQDVGGAAVKPRVEATSFKAASFDVKLIGGDGSELDPDAAEPTIDSESGRFSGPFPPTNGFSNLVEPFVPDLVTSGGTATVTIDSIVPGNPVEGAAAEYFVTFATPAGTVQKVIELTIGYFGDNERNDASVGFDLVQPGTEVGSRFNIDPTKVKLTGLTTLSAPDNYFQTQQGRGWVNGAVASGVGMSKFTGPRWFVSGQAEAEDPNASIGIMACLLFGDCDRLVGQKYAGEIPGYVIFPTKSYFTTVTRLRAPEGVLSTVRRVADIEVTWGASGKPSKVFDVTHKVDVPYSPNLRASYGFLTSASFAGVTAANTLDGRNDIITSSDWTCISPLNELAAAGETEFASAQCRAVPGALLQDAAVITQIDSTWGGGSATGTGRGTSFAGARNGFAMYINGETFFFFGNSLPADGDKWTLRTYAGTVGAVAVTDAGGNTTDVNGYEFGSVVRPPNVPGLKAEISLTPTEIVAANRDVRRVHTVPDPFIVTSVLQSTPEERRIKFVNLPDQATIRIFSLSGVLVDAIEHNDPAGGGEAFWDLRNRNNQYVATGVYFFHVQSPDGKSKVGKFTVVQGK